MSGEHHEAYQTRQITESCDDGEHCRHKGCERMCCWCDFEKEIETDPDLPGRKEL